MALLRKTLETLERVILSVNFILLTEHLTYKIATITSVISYCCNYY